MTYEISAIQDDNFTISNSLDCKINVPDVVVEELPEEHIEQIRYGAIPAPTENAKGLGWFDGTSWGTK